MLTPYFYISSDDFWPSSSSSSNISKFIAGTSPSLFFCATRLEAFFRDDFLSKVNPMICLSGDMGIFVGVANAGVDLVFTKKPSSSTKSTQQI